MFSKKAAVLFAVLASLVIIATFLFMTARRGWLTGPAGGVVITVFSPFQEAATATVDYFSSIWEHYFFLVQTSQKNEALEKKLAQLHGDMDRCREVEAQNGRLLALLEFKEKTPYQMISAQVVAKDPSDWFESLIINRGTKDGVVPGLCVATPQGIVGKVIHASRGYSKVLFITDPASALDVRITRTRTRAILEGAAKTRCRLKYILAKEDLSVGDKVIASGLDNIFPPGLMVGEVMAVGQDPQGLFKDVLVKPFVDFERLEEVFVVAWEKPVPMEDQSP